MAKNERFVKSINGASGLVNAVDSAVVDTNASLVANSDVLVPSQKAVKSAIATALTTAENYADAAVTSAVLLKKATIILSNAQIKALPTTVIAILGALGANKVPHLFGIDLVANFAVDYSNAADGCNILISIGGDGLGSFDWAQQFVAGVNSGGAALFVPNATYSTPRVCWIPSIFNMSGGIDAFPLVNIPSPVNSPLHLSLLNSGLGDLTGGDPANTLKVTVWYAEVDVT